jgi:hypothetical protein
MALTPEQIKRREISFQEYQKLEDDETIEDIFDFMAHSVTCRHGYGPKQGEGMEDQEIVESLADEYKDEKHLFTNIIPQGYKLLAMTPFPWKGIGMRAELLWPRGYNEAQVRQWLEDQLKLLEAEAKKRGWLYLVR